MDSLNSLKIGPLVIFLGIALGAFGAHGLTPLLSPLALSTFQTGVTYQNYHGLALLILGILGNLKVLTPRSLRAVHYLFLAGIILFSGNCYLYALTQIKLFALLVPLGGLSFLSGWIFIFLQVRQVGKTS